MGQVPNYGINGNRVKITGWRATVTLLQLTGEVFPA